MINLINNIPNLPSATLSHWAYWLLLLTVTLECSPIFGLLVPGVALVVVCGFLAKLQVLDLGDVIVVSAIGAIFGDFLGYILGRKYGLNFVEKYGRYFFLKKEHYEKTKTLMHNHVGKVLVIGRLTSVTRTFGPFVAGVTKISFIKFFLYNLAGGISWAVSYALVGYLFGRSYEIAAGYIETSLLVFIIIAVLIIYCYRFCKKRKISAMPRACKSKDCL